MEVNTSILQSVRVAVQERMRSKKCVLALTCMRSCDANSAFYHALAYEKERMRLSMLECVDCVKCMHSDMLACMSSNVYVRECKSVCTAMHAFQYIGAWSSNVRVTARWSV